MQIHPAIPCAGNGTRLWPLSREDVAKPFLPLIGEGALFEQAMRRVAGDDSFAPLVVLAGASDSDLIEAQLGDAQGALLVVEPEAKNTVPAIGLAAPLLPPAPAPDTRCRGEVFPWLHLRKFACFVQCSV